jgi:hypothetical protein
MFVLSFTIGAGTFGSGLTSYTRVLTRGLVPRLPFIWLLTLWEGLSHAATSPAIKIDGTGEGA